MAWAKLRNEKTCAGFFGLSAGHIKSIEPIQDFKHGDK